MRVLIAPHHFGTSFTPDIAAEALAQGWREAKPSDDVRTHPLSDGSAGFLEVVPGEREIFTVLIDGAAHPITVVRRPSADNPWHTVYCTTDSFLSGEAVDETALFNATSAPVGELLAELYDKGAKRVVIGAAHAPWHDGGAGLLAGLAQHLGISVPSASARLDGGQIDPRIAEVFGEVRQRLRGVSIVVASAREVPLRGLHGAGAELSETHGLTAAAAQQVESLAAEFVTAIDTRVKSAALPSLLGGDAAPLVSRRPYAGAGGGVAFILVALGATIYPGSWVTGEETGLDEVMGDVDIVITGADVIAGEELGEGVVAGVAAKAAEHAIPVIVVGAQVDASRRQLSKVGVHASYPVIDTPAGRPQITAPQITRADLVARGARLAKSWSR